MEEQVSKMKKLIRKYCLYGLILTVVFSFGYFVIQAITFAIGMIVMAVLTYHYMGEGITTKTAVSLVLATTLVSIQILWK